MSRKDKDRKADLVYYWHSVPGTFVNKLTGTVAMEAKASPAGPLFCGTEREWNETLAESVYDLKDALIGKDVCKGYVRANGIAFNILKTNIYFNPSSNSKLLGIYNINIELHADKKLADNLIKIVGNGKVGFIEVLS